MGTYEGTTDDLSTMRERAAQYVERGWTQGDYARDETGGGVVPLSSYAVCWCLLGAIRVAVGQTTVQRPWEPVGDIQEALIKELGLDEPFMTLADWNDAPGRTAEEVAAVLRGRQR